MELRGELRRERYERPLCAANRSISGVHALSGSRLELVPEPLLLLLPREWQFSIGRHPDRCRHYSVAAVNKLLFKSI